MNPRCAWLLIFVVLAPISSAQNLRVAAASDLQSALPEVIEAFRKAHSGKVDVVFASSGTLYAQIVNGAPYDVFLSADEGYARRLIESGAATQDSFVLYARGHLALWSPRHEVVAAGLAGLKDAKVKRIAIANPRHAPYGRAAEAALTSAGLHDALAPKLLLAENIAQAAQFVQAGNADAGIIALSLAKSAAMRGGSYVEIPQEFYSPLLQAAVRTSRSRNANAARFLAFLTSAAAREILSRHGFSAPENER